MLLCRSRSRVVAHCSFFVPLFGLLVACADPAVRPAGGEITDADASVSSPSTGVAPGSASTDSRCVQGVSTPLPEAFRRWCAGCHGGESAANTPDLSELDLEFEAFAQIVREGSGDMPRLGRAQVSDSELRALYAFLTAPEVDERCAGTQVEGACGTRFELSNLFDEALSTNSPIVSERDDGVIVTRGAGRVRNRHELEGTFSTYGPRYFENRSFAFEVVDHVGKGESRVEIVYMPEAPASQLGPQTNFRFFKVLGDGNVFHANVDLRDLGSGRQGYTIERHGREDRPLRKGDVIEFEFGIFLSGNVQGDVDPVEGRTAYYSDTFRYQVGLGGLTPENIDPSGMPGPAADNRPGGDLTIPWIYAEPQMYFSQLALNVQPQHVQDFLRGRRLFHTDFGSGEHSEANNPSFETHAGKLGPKFHTGRCSNCHEHNGRGHLAAPGEELTSVVVKLYRAPELGRQLAPQDAVVRVDAMQSVTANGVELVRPLFAAEGYSLEALGASPRIARRLVGMGLLEAIDEETLLERADPDDCDGDGIRGRPQLVPDPRDGALRLGRFGWRAEKVSVEHQVADALDVDLGVSSSLFPEEDGSVELSPRELAQLVTYVRLLGVAPRRGVTSERVRNGEEVFQRLGCPGCHVPKQQTGNRHPFVELHQQTIWPYTDLLLHDMGEALDDGSGEMNAQYFRTPPLWGLGLLEAVSGELSLLHDGRARSLEEAILWHGGEAEFAQRAFTQLSREDRQALLAFLRSL